MKTILMLLCAALLFGCDDSPKPGAAERELNTKIEQANKRISDNANWIIAMGEKEKVPRYGRTPGDLKECFFWDLGSRGRAYMLMDSDSRLQIKVGYYRELGHGMGVTLDCCDDLPYTDDQKKRVDQLYGRWQEYMRLEAVRNKYHDLDNLRKRLDSLIPAESEKQR